jgi:putative Holliday junction resolvase
MGKIIGIDYGTKRVGIAICDELHMFASPLETIHSEELIEYLRNKIQNESIEGIVIGSPVGLKGEETNITKIVDDLIIHLSRTFPDLDVWPIDERFTSKMAAQIVAKSGLSKSKRKDKTLLDKVSASIILQSFLDRKSMK